MGALSKACRIGIVAIASVLCIAFADPAVRAQPSSEPTADERRRNALQALHDGRFDAAERTIEPLANRTDARSGDALLHAFVTYWRTLYDPDDKALQKELERRLKRTINLATAELAANSDDSRSAEATLWKGSAHMLRAQLRAAQKKIFGAAFEAKKAKKLLERAVEQGSAPVESDFGLGTYQYYADMLPAVVKGLRAILFIPGGNRDEGLERLQRASRESRYFGLESRIILANIYADDKERMYAEADAVVADALARYPDTIAALQGAARLDLALNRPALALQRLDHAFDVTEAHGDTAASVLLTLHYYAGAAEYLRFRPDRALELWRPILADPDAAPDPLVRRLHRAAPAFLLVPDRPEWTRTIAFEPMRRPSDDPGVIRDLRAAGAALERARPALERERAGDDAGALAALEALVVEHPDDPMTALLTGRARLRNGRGASALPLLERASNADDLPESYAGVARLLAGMAADAAGTRDAALDWYHEAESNHRFYGRDAARMYQLTPYVETGKKSEPVASQ